MKRILIYCGLILILGSSGDQCISCTEISGYPNAVICKDTYETTIDDQAPVWAEYQETAVTAGCIKQ